jgi:hypothetical protein
MSTPPQEQTIGGATLATLTGGAWGALGGAAPGAIAARVGGSAGGTLLRGGGGAASGAVSRAASGRGAAPRPITGLETRGIRPAPGTRVRPEGIPDNWRIRNTRDPGGTWYYDPTNKGNAVRVMQGNPNSAFPNSQSPYVRWQQNGHPLDVFGNKLPTARTPDAHIPLGDFRFLSELFR